MANLEVKYVERFALKSIKDLENEILKKNKMNFLGNIKAINVTQIHIIKYLLDNKDCEVYQKDFETLLNIRKSTISGILSTMEKNKIIKRLPAESGKGKLIELTPEVLKLGREVISKLKDLEDELVEGISEEDMEAFYRVIDKMTENIKKKGNDKNDKDV